MRRLTKINLKKIEKSGTVNTLLKKQPRRWKINVKLFRDSLVESFPIYCFCHKKKLFSCSTKHHYIIHFQFIVALSQWILIVLRFTYSHPNKALVLWFVTHALWKDVHKLSCKRCASFFWYTDTKKFPISIIITSHMFTSKRCRLNE